MEALSELESSVIAFQDSRRSSKDKTALIEYFGGLQKCIELSTRVGQTDPDPKRCGLQHDSERGLLHF